MGALVCYELAQELRRRGGPTPVHIFVSGSPAPHLAALVPPIYDLPEDRFLEAVRRFGGLPEEVLASRDLLDLLMPRLRADLAVTGTYAYAEDPPLACPITAFGGLNDDVVSCEAIEGWRDHTVSAFQFNRYPGGHFFLSPHASSIVPQLASALLTPANGELGV
jgi:medium-chain acyl-[acyl-carrier-protein] hydrolase